MLDMAGLNYIREAYEQVYSQLDERMDPEERALRRAEIADKKSSRMDSKAAAKYADSEAKSASREDKKSRGKHIHGMADSYEVDGDLVDEELTQEELEQLNELSNRKLRAYLKKSQKSADTLNKKWDQGKASYKEKSKVIGHEEGQRRALKRLNKESVETLTEFEEEQLNELSNRKLRAYLKKSQKSADTLNKKWDQGTATYREKSKVIGHEEGQRRALKKLNKEETAKDGSYLETDMKKRQKNNEKAVEAMKKTKAYADMVKAARKHFEEVELSERELDPTEKREKERLVKGLKKSAADFKKRYGERAKSVMYATATKMAKDHMDTSKSDRRYSAER